MSIGLRILIDVLIGLGVVFAVTGTVGIIRMPDALTRMQAATCIATLGLLLVVIAGVIYEAAVMHDWGSAVKVLLIGVVYIIANPAGSHAIARAANRRGNETVDMVCDDFKEEAEKK